MDVLDPCEVNFTLSDKNSSDEEKHYKIWVGAHKGEKEAIRSLGGGFAFGALGYRKDLRKAHEWTMKFYQEYGELASSLIDLYEQDPSLIEDPKLAGKILQEAVNTCPDPKYLSILACAYKNDTQYYGLQQDEELAFNFLCKSANLMYAGSFCALGKEYIQRGEHIKAIEWLSKAVISNAGKEEALFELGMLYCHGYPGILFSDYEKAKLYFSALPNDFRAKVTLLSLPNLSDFEREEVHANILHDISKIEDICTQKMKEAYLEFYLLDIESAIEKLREAEFFNPDIINAPEYIYFLGILEPLINLPQDKIFFEGHEEIDFLEENSTSEETSLGSNLEVDEVSSSQIDSSEHRVLEGDKEGENTYFELEDQGHDVVTNNMNDEPLHDQTLEPSSVPKKKLSKKTLKKFQKVQRKEEEREKDLRKHKKRLASMAHLLKKVEIPNSFAFNQDVRFVFTSSGIEEMYQGILEGDFEETLQGKLSRFIEDIKVKPWGLQGEGKAEPLKGSRRGQISRRLNHEDRFIYSCLGTNSAGEYEVLVHQVFGHYDD